MSVAATAATQIASIRKALDMATSAATPPPGPFDDWAPVDADVPGWIHPDGTPVHQHRDERVLWLEDYIEDKVREAAPFNFVSALEIFAELPPVQWCVERLRLAPGRVNMIGGYGYSGKTIGVQDLALCVAVGDEYVWGEFAPKQGRVVHIDHEQGFRATARRYQRLAYARGLSPHDIGNSLKLATLPETYITSQAAEDHYMRACDGATLCIIDSLRAATPGVEENDSAMRVYLDNLTRVSDRTGCTFLIIHHAGKGERDARETLRGTSAIFDACGTVFIFQPHDGGVNETIVSVTCGKTTADAYGGRVDPFCLRVRDVPDGANPYAGLECRYVAQADYDASANTPEGKMSIAKAAVLAFVTANPGVSTREIREGVTGNNDTNTAARDTLIREGVIVTRGGSRGAMLHYLASDTGGGA